MRILVTGGGGFLGTNVCLWLARAGHKVLAIDVNPARRSILGGGGVKFLEADCDDVDLEKDVVDFVLHFAATSVSTAGDLWTTFGNVAPSLRMFEQAARLDIPLVFTSTCKVYSHRQMNARRAKTFDDVARSWYGCSKAACDLYAQEWISRGARFSIHRPTTLYGPHQRGSAESGWVDWFLRAKREGLPITIYGDGEQSRDILWVEDYARLVETVVEKPDEWIGAFEVGTGMENTISLNNVIAWLDTKPGPKLQVTYVPERRHADYDEWFSEMSGTATRGWEPEVKPMAGLEMLWNWYEKQ